MRKPSWARYTSMAFAALLVQQTPAKAEPLKPLSNWILDYREDQCLAFKQFGTTEAPITLGIRPAPNGESYELLVSNARSGPANAIETKGWVDFGRGKLKSWVLNYGSARLGTIVQYRISAADMAEASFADHVILHNEGTGELVFPLNAMDDLLKGLETCTADLRAYWNAGGEKDGRLRSGAKGEVRAIFSSNDYPDQAVQNWQEGTSQFILLINEKGAVAGCFLEKPSGVPLLDAVGCQVIRKRARFRPAIDAHGKPARSTYVTPPVTWHIEG